MKADITRAANEAMQVEMKTSDFEKREFKRIKMNGYFNQMGTGKVSTIIHVTAGVLPT